MKYKVKETNITKLKKYIDADTETKSEREAKRFYDSVCGTNDKGIQRTISSDMLQNL
tara:strand:+ start:2133 stop:2303 length:171 start_codon:yes stop_codon:yes gene_type:complete